MKIEALRVAELGPFASGVAVENFSGRFDVFPGANEAGKSSLFGALRLVLTQKHGSKSQTDVLSFVPYAGGAPLVEVDLAVGGRRVRVRKRFASQPMAHVEDLASGQRWRGPDAEAELERLLASAQASPFQNLLWVAQRESFDLPAAKGLAPHLMALVESATAGATGEGLSRAVAARLRVDLARHVTASRRQPCGDYAAALARQKALVEDLERARQREASARQQAAEMERLSDTLVGLRAAVPQRADTVQRLEDTLAKATRDRERLVAAERAERTCRALQSEKETGAARLAQSLTALAGLSGEVEAARVQCAAAEIEVRDATQAATVAEADHTTARAALDACRRDLERARIGALQAALDEAHACRSEIETLEHALAAMVVRPEHVARLSELSRALDRAEAALATALPTLAASYVAGGEARFVVDGRALDAGECLRIDRPLAVTVPGVGTLTVTPGADAARQRAERDALLRDREVVLAQAGVPDVEAAHRALSEADDMRRRLSAAGERLSRLAPDGTESLDAAVAARAAEIGVPRDTIAPGDAAAVERAAAAVRAAEQAVAVADDAARRQHDALRARERRLEAARTAMAALTARADALAAGLPPADLRQAALDEARRLAEEAREQADAAASERLVIARDVPDAQRMAEAEAALARARQDLAAAAAEVERTTKRIAEIEGFLRGHTDDGVDARVDDLAQELGAIDARVADMSEEVAALDLAVRVLDEAEQRRRDTVMRPLMSRLQPLVDAVIPGLRLGLSDPLTLADPERAGRAERAQRLSDGTREQIAVLVRLAYAGLLADRGTPVPLVLDDALVFSDDARLAAVAGVLAHAASRHQVVLLTCHEKAFAGLIAETGANRLTVSPWEPARIEPRRVLTPTM